MTRLRNIRRIIQKYLRFKYVTYIFIIFIGFAFISEYYGWLNKPLALSFRAEFDKSQVNGIEKVAKLVAKKWSVVYYEHDKVLYNSNPWDTSEFFHLFIVFLHDDEDLTGMVSIMSVGDSVDVFFSDKDIFSLNTLQRLASELVCTLEEKAGLKFKRRDPKSDQTITPFFENETLNCDYKSE